MRIGHIENGIVLDHITAGNGINIYNVLNLGKLDCAVALIKNAESPNPTDAANKAARITIQIFLQRNLNICNKSIV